MRVPIPLSPWRATALALLVAAAVWLLPPLALPGRVAATVAAAGLALALVHRRTEPSRHDTAGGEIHAQAARMRSIVETATEGIIAIDEAGRIDTFNGAAERMFGYTAAEVIGQNVRLLMPEP